MQDVVLVLRASEHEGWNLDVVDPDRWSKGGAWGRWVREVAEMERLGRARRDLNIPVGRRPFLDVLLDAHRAGAGLVIVGSTVAADPRCRAAMGVA